MLLAEALLRVLVVPYGQRTLGLRSADGSKMDSHVPKPPAMRSSAGPHCRSSSSGANSFRSGWPRWPQCAPASPPCPSGKTLSFGAGKPRLRGGGGRGLRPQGPRPLRAQLGASCRENEDVLLPGHPLDGGKRDGSERRVGDRQGQSPLGGSSSRQRSGQAASADCRTSVNTDLTKPRQYDIRRSLACSCRLAKRRSCRNQD